MPNVRLAYNRIQLLKLCPSHEEIKPCRSARNKIFASRLRQRRFMTNIKPPKHFTITSNPTEINLSILNTRSANKRFGILHDTINDNKIDVLALTETWITESAPDTIKLGVTPNGFSVLHSHRGACAAVSKSVSPGFGDCTQ